jgi:hypothetical protein
MVRGDGQHCKNSLTSSQCSHKVVEILSSAALARRGRDLLRLQHKLDTRLYHNSQHWRCQEEQGQLVQRPVSQESDVPTAIC